MAGAAEYGPSGAATMQPRRASDGTLSEIGDWHLGLLRVQPPQWGFLFGALGAAAHGLVWGFASPWGNAPLTGLSIAAAGLAWLLWAFTLHRAAGNPIRPTDAPLVLVDEGPFAQGRHPMYLGLVAMLAGIAFAVGSPFIGAAAAGLALLLDRVHIRHEEAQLAARFGGWWRDYVERVGRWM